MKHQLKKDALYWASFARFELRLSGKAVIDCSRRGHVDDAVAHHTPLVIWQAEADNFHNAPTPAKIRAELKGYGAWSTVDLNDLAANWRRIVWIAACDIAESDEPDCSAPCQPETVYISTSKPTAANPPQPA